MRTEEQVRADIVECGRRLWHRGFVASNDGTAGGAISALVLPFTWLARRENASADLMPDDEAGELTATA